LGWLAIPRQTRNQFISNHLRYRAAFLEFGRPIAIDNASASTEIKLEGKSDGGHKDTDKVSEDPEGQKAREERTARRP
jgi:hypothetical protein